MTLWRDSMRSSSVQPPNSMSRRFVVQVRGTSEPSVGQGWCGQHRCHCADRHGDPSGERTRRIDQQRRGTRPRSSPQLRTAHPRSRPQSSGRCLGEGSIQGLRITGKRLGLLGFGRIARGVAQGALALGMEVGFHDPYLPDTAHLLQMSTDSIRSIRWFVSQPI